MLVDILYNYITMHGAKKHEILFILIKIRTQAVIDFFNPLAPEFPFKF